MQYQPPKQTGSCGEVWMLTRALFGMLLPPLLGILAVLVWLYVTISLFFRSAPLALIPLALGVIVVVLYIRWDRNRGAPVE